MTCRHWCFTLYGETLPFGGQTDVGFGILSGVRYAVYQRELCPTSGRLHYQGYIEFGSPVRITGAVHTAGTGAHCERRLGTRDQAREYCMQASKRLAATEPTEVGEWQSGGQGRRTDIADALNIVRSNPTPAGVEALYDNHGPIMVKYARGMANAVTHYQSRIPRTDPPSVFVHYGPTGTGKTYTVYDRHGMSDVWRAPVSTTSTMWFDGYMGQKVALFDDFDGIHPNITVMLQVLDRYPVQVPVKGSHAFFNPTTIYITTNIPFDEWYPDAKDAHRLALKRRITECIHFEYLGPFDTSEP